MNYCILGAAKSGVAVAQLAATVNTIKNYKLKIKKCSFNDRHCEQSVAIHSNNKEIATHPTDARNDGHSNSEIFITEIGPAENFSEAITVFDSIGAKYEFGSNSQTVEKAEKILPDFDCLIVSPGVPPSSNFIVKAQELNIPVISELEFAFQNLKNPIIAITGTNGKTTTTSLITYILNKAGKPAIAAGNIGLPLSVIANEILNNNNTIQNSKFKIQNCDNNTVKGICNIDENTILVVEVSSFQLEFIDKFRPKVAIILNITPDHLNYHKTFENYKNAKLKIAKNQTSDDYLILNADDENLTVVNDKWLMVNDGKSTVDRHCEQSVAIHTNKIDCHAEAARNDGDDINHLPLTINHYRENNIKSNIYQFSLSPVERGIYLQDGKMIDNLQHKKEEIMHTKEIKIPGTHNHYNSMAAAITAKVWQLTNEDLRDSLKQFQGVEHRLEFVQTINGVDYINDSKATNVNAAWYALSSYSKPIIWLAGGQGDNNDYSLLDKVIAKNVKKIISFGEESEAVYSRYSQTVDCEKVETLYDAVKLAHSIAKNGEVVLFTPACKSFDQFLNYEQRGEVFKQAVYSLVVGVN